MLPILIESFHLSHLTFSLVALRRRVFNEWLHERKTTVNARLDEIRSWEDRHQPIYEEEEEEEESGVRRNAHRRGRGEQDDEGLADWDQEERDSGSASHVPPPTKLSHAFMALVDSITSEYDLLDKAPNLQLKFARGIQLKLFDIFQEDIGRLALLLCVGDVMCFPFHFSYFLCDSPRF